MPSLPPKMRIRQKGYKKPLDKKLLYATNCQKKTNKLEIRNKLKTRN